MKNGPQRENFGMLKDTNKEWVKLVSEMTTYRKDNMSGSWPKAQQYASSVNSYWLEYSPPHFRYRYDAACKRIDGHLGLDNSGKTQKFDSCVNLYQFQHTSIRLLTNKTDDSKTTDKSSSSAVLATKSARENAEFSFDLRSMFIQYELNLPMDVLEEGYDIDDIMANNNCLEMSSEKKLCFLMYLPTGSKISAYEIHPDMTSMEITICLHKLMWHPQATHHTIMKSCADALNSKRGAIRESELNRAMHRLKGIVNNVSGNEKEIVAKVTFRQPVDVKRNKEGMTFQQITFPTSANNNFQVAFAYFEFDVKNPNEQVQGHVVSGIFHIFDKYHHFISSTRIEADEMEWGHSHAVYFQTEVFSTDFCIIFVFKGTQMTPHSPFIMFLITTACEIVTELGQRITTQIILMSTRHTFNEPELQKLINVHRIEVMIFICKVIPWIIFT